MDRVIEASNLVKQLNAYRKKEIEDYEFIKVVCTYFDKVKDLDFLSPSDLKFLKYISNVAGIPHYYDLLFSKFNHSENFLKYDLNTFSSLLYESSLHVDEEIKIHKYQKKVLDSFEKGKLNHYFLSASTSFGKTYLIYEIIKKMEYKNIILVFPTIALLSENFEKLMTNIEYKFFRDNFKIHTLSDVEDFEDRNIFIYTPERYLSFIDKNNDFNIDFVFVDEIYKIDNEYLTNDEKKENERDTAYRVALYNLLSLQRDALLVGPYINFPNPEDNNINQSFNKFLKANEFKILDFNNIEIVNKSFKEVYSSNIHNVDEELTISLDGLKTNKQKIPKIVAEIRKINQNMIIYTKGSGTAETMAKNVIEYSKSNKKQSEELKELIAHLKKTFIYSDWSVIKGLENNIAIHHGLVPKYVQKEIIKLFNTGDIDILISTTTITEGVNTSAKNLIVTSAKKGDKPLKTFDAKNIAGRAGRFLYHYSGRVLIYEKEFSKIINGKDDEIKHKNYDENSSKNEIDYFITENEYLDIKDIDRKNEIEIMRKERGIPLEIIQAYKVISYSDKIKIYDEIIKLLNNKKESYLSMKASIGKIAHNLYLDYDGLTLILSIIYPIVKNDKLKFFIDFESEIKKEGKNKGKKYSILIYMLSAYIESGHIGNIKYNKEKRKLRTDEAIREASQFIYNTLKYQLVKYLGVFNIMYKFIESKRTNIDINKIVGIDKLLRKLEYNATSELGKLASDYGVPSKIIDYYDNEEKQDEIKKSFDSFELKKFEQVENIINNKQ
ncbi:helicase-related protein [Aliarcobacter butzleri]|uniref:helicase-related protein n=1 Tax=Aliarcobacter butzleri TaxID=28197 RepID=UPI001EDA8A4D|nr:helicase-related protein [Aliarcobacter butzleri]MCG3712571.1 DEAD/DEAH box helicase family protein [Aliarcobacter butzleri]MCT7632020.1 helicase-related protein [Aliarcobacter butzleri]MDN5082701.1 helicase-related protein [Aliarcobacter butzleri]MDN5084685.1 helicase-related protein [Aliarcobacter butzleri]